MAVATRVVLASASPRRRDLLLAAGLEFEVEVSDVDEDVAELGPPEELAVLLAERKARAVAARHAAEHVLVIGADTIVAVDTAGGTRILGKPGSPREARGMLALLSGSRHRVVTGVCVVRSSDGTAASDFERTWVSMRPITEPEIDTYVASGEWRDKAGGYAIQESADAFVTGLEEGGFDNVVGLPVERTLAVLGRLPRGLSGG